MSDSLTAVRLSPSALRFVVIASVTWDKAGDETALNWRVQSRLAEVWLLKVK